jgi:hypothetical protein
MPHPDGEMTPESLALWYLRLNGFFTIPSYVVHPDRAGGALTDIDVAGVRFPHRREFPHGPGGDDTEITRIASAQPLIALVEVKTSICNLNGPWVNADAHTVERLLGDLGLVPEGSTPSAAAALRASASYADPSLTIRLVCLGRERNPELQSRYPNLPQRTWNEVARFIYARLNEYGRRKTDNRHWDEAGTLLWATFRSSQSEAVFCSDIGRTFRVDAA